LTSIASWRTSAPRSTFRGARRVTVRRTRAPRMSGLD